jgi:hypothetical protein
LLLGAAALVVLALLLYPSQQCHISETELKSSPLKAFAISTLDGYAVGFSFNVTNQAGCEATARNMHVVLRSVTYANGTEVTQNLDETDSVNMILSAGSTGLFSHTFNSYTPYKPAELNLRVEMTFAETGTISIFDGELNVSK